MSKVSTASEITRENFRQVELDLPSETKTFTKLSGRVATYEGKRVLILSGNALLDLSIEEDDLDSAVIHLEDDATLGLTLEAGQEALGFAAVKAQVDEAVAQFESLNPMGPAQSIKFAALGDIEGAFAAYPDAQNLADVNAAVLEERLEKLDPIDRMMLMMGM